MTSCPDPVIAVHAHHMAAALFRLRGAELEYSAVEARAADAGVPVAAVKRALLMVVADPLDMEADERRVGQVLTAIGAAVVLDHAEQFERITDESAEERTARLHREGFFAAILGRPGTANGYRAGSADDRAWSEGFGAFRALLRKESGMSGRVRRAIPA